MNRRFAVAVFGVLMAASLAPAVRTSVSVFMWKAEKDGAAVYLLGSVHALKESPTPCRR